MLEAVLISGNELNIFGNKFFYSNSNSISYIKGNIHSNSNINSYSNSCSNTNTNTNTNSNINSNSKRNTLTLLKYS